MAHSFFPVSSAHYFDTRHHTAFLVLEGVVEHQRRTQIGCKINATYAVIGFLATPLLTIIGVVAALLRPHHTGVRVCDVCPCLPSNTAKRARVR